MSNTLRDVAADIIFMGGDIITVDDGHPSAEALAIRDGRIAAVGTHDEVLRQKGENTRIVDLAGKTLMPGFIEAHSHVMASALFYDWIDISGFTHNSGVEVIETLRVAATKAEPGQWIAAFGYDPVQVRDITGFNVEILDEISTTNPIFVMQQNIHTTFVNHKAFEVMGITSQTPDPEFGKYGRDKDGNLTGAVIEQGAFHPVIDKINIGNQDREFELIKRQVARYAHAGYTTVADMGAFTLVREWERILKEVIPDDDCPIRMTVLNTAIELERGQSIDIGIHGDRLKEGGVKFWYDGSFLTGNVLLEEGYLQSDLMLKRLGMPGDNWRHGMMPKETLCNLVRKYHDQGQQLITHAQGDRAIRDVIDAYEAALKASPRDDHRHRIEHCGLFPLDEMRRAAELGLTLSIHPNYIYYYGDAVRDEILGIERSNVLMPAGAAVNSGLRISLHNDSPMFPPEPMRLLQTAVTRKNKSGEIIGSDQAIDIDAAIKAITIDAAYQLFLDQKVGSIEVGKLADLVMLSDNPRQIDPEQLYRIQVVDTWREGKRYANK